MSSTATFAPGSPAELVFDIGGKLTDALNTLARLSALVRPSSTAPVTQAPVLPARRKAPPVQAPAAPVPVTSWMNAPAPALRPRYIAPVAQAPQKVRQVRRQGAADRIVTALLSPTGVLASQLRDIAGYPCGPTVLDRLSASRGFTWYETGEGVKRRFIGNMPKPIAPARRR
jgi:hypothetical protein